MTAPLTRAEIMALGSQQLRLQVAERIFGTKAFVVGKDDTVFIHREYLDMGDCWYLDGDYQEVLPDYPKDIAAAWTVHKAACGWLFSVRKRYFRELQETVSLHVGDGLSIVAWPDALIFVEPQDFCRAALLAQAGAKGG